MTDLAYLRELLEAATEGPWSYTRCACGHPSCDQVLLSISGAVGPHLNDAALIVAAVNSLPALIEEIEKLRAENASLRERMSDMMPIAGGNPMKHKGGSTALSTNGGKDG